MEPTSTHTIEMNSPPLPPIDAPPNRQQQPAQYPEHQSVPVETPVRPISRSFFPLHSDLIELLDRLIPLMDDDLSKKGLSTIRHSKSPEEAIESLRNQIEMHNQKYHVEGEPVIDDEDFDGLLKHLISLEKQHQSTIPAESPTQRVGPKLDNNTEPLLQHKIPMLSLANAFRPEDLDAFVERITKKNVPPHFIIEPKIDGVSVSLIYENGKFLKALSRGNGITGEDITAQIRQISSLPKHINDKIQYLEVRAEAYIEEEIFRSINRENKEKGLKTFQNPRNLAAGTLKLKDLSKVTERSLSIRCYTLSRIDGYEGPKSQDEALKLLEDLGFKTVHSDIVLIDNPSELSSRILSYKQDILDNLEYETDGAVIKLRNLNDQKKLGATSHHPRWAIAWKYPPEQKETTVLRIITQIGRHGNLTPVAEVEPVKLDGTTVERASLYNFAQQKILGAYPGTRVLIEKAGKIIPRIVSAVPSKEYRFSNFILAGLECNLKNIIDIIMLIKNLPTINNISDNKTIQREQTRRYAEAFIEAWTNGKKINNDHIERVSILKTITEREIEKIVYTQITEINNKKTEVIKEELEKIITRRNTKEDNRINEEINNLKNKLDQQNRKHNTHIDKNPNIRHTISYHTQLINENHKTVEAYINKAHIDINNITEKHYETKTENNTIIKAETRKENTQYYIEEAKRANNKKKESSLEILINEENTSFSIKQITRSLEIKIYEENLATTKKIRGLTELLDNKNQEKITIVDASPPQDKEGLDFRYNELKETASLLASADPTHKETEEQIKHALQAPEDNIKKLQEIQIKIDKELTYTIKIGMDNLIREENSGQTECPACGEPAEQLKDKVAIRCINKHCPGIIEQQIAYFAGRDAMDIKGLGMRWIQKLIEDKSMRWAPDLYTLTYENIKELPGAADKSAQNLMASIDKSRDQPLWRVISGIGISDVGVMLAKELAKTFRSLEGLKKADEETLTACEGVGAQVAQSIDKWLKENGELIDALIGHGINPQYSPPPSEAYDTETHGVTTHGILSGDSVLVTGVLQTMTREEANEAIIQHGGKALKSFTKAVSLVVFGDKPGSKYTKAQENGIRTIDEEEFITNYINKKQTNPSI